MKIIRPEDPIQTTSLIMMIVGQPGIGKTTLAMSAKNPILFDFDLGASRAIRGVNASVAQPENYAELMAFIQSPEIRDFSTAVFDTAGAFVETIIFNQVRSNPSYWDGFAGMPNQKGWGVVKNLFTGFFNAIRASGLSVVFVAHEKQETAKRGDVSRSVPQIVGSASQIILQACQQVGFMYAEGQRRVLDFSVDQTHTSKDTAGIGKVEILPYGSNDHQLADVVTVCKERIIKNANQHTAAAGEIAELRLLIAGIDDADSANMVLERILDYSGAAKDALKVEIFARCGKVGLIYNKETKQYETAPAN